MHTHSHPTDHLVYIGSMPLPISKEQLKKLGERIANADPPTDADLQQLNLVIRSYQDILITVESELTKIGLTATCRVKTRDVLIDKLRRERNMALPRIQDLAGARVVVGGGRTTQDDVVRKIISHFDNLMPKPCKPTDRRIHDSHGYRAVHVIAFPEMVPVEIQVRTELQDYWAQIMESLADKWGRGIRYGDPPEDSDSPVIGIIGNNGIPATRQDIIDNLQIMSTSLDEFERIEQEIRNQDSLLSESTDAPTGDQIGTMEINELNASSLYQTLRGKFKQTMSQIDQDRRKTGRLVRRTVPKIESPDVDYVKSRLSLCNSIAWKQSQVIENKLTVQYEKLRGILQLLRERVEEGDIR